MSSRSAKHRYRADGASNETVGMPPPSRNHRTPTAAETPASMPAASLGTPRAIASQNHRR